MLRPSIRGQRFVRDHFQKFQPIATWPATPPSRMPLLLLGTGGSTTSSRLRQRLLDRRGRVCIVAHPNVAEACVIGHQTSTPSQATRLRVPPYGEPSPPGAAGVIRSEVAHPDRQISPRPKRIIWADYLP